MRKHGDWNAICDLCGQKFKASQLRRRWDGMMVCQADFETRHPQDLIRGKRDSQAVPWVRPEGADLIATVNPLDPDDVIYTPAPECTAAFTSYDNKRISSLGGIEWGIVDMVTGDTVTWFVSYDNKIVHLSDGFKWDITDITTGESSEFFVAYDNKLVLVSSLFLQSICTLMPGEDIAFTSYDNKRITYLVGGEWGIVDIDTGVATTWFVSYDNKRVSLSSGREWTIADVDTGEVSEFFVAYDNKLIHVRSKILQSIGSL